jgi:CubicO group peptidase (beta-lactamase class C family)
MAISGRRTDGTFAARGIFGQGIFIDPKRKTVIASNGDWAAGAADRIASQARAAFYRAAQKAIDDEAAGMPNSAPVR